MVIFMQWWCNTIHCSSVGKQKLPLPAATAQTDTTLTEALLAFKAALFVFSGAVIKDQSYKSDRSPG